MPNCASADHFVGSRGAGFKKCLKTWECSSFLGVRLEKGISKQYLILLLSMNFKFLRQDAKNLQRSGSKFLLCRSRTVKTCPEERLSTSFSVIYLPSTICQSRMV